MEVLGSNDKINSALERRFAFFFSMKKGSSFTAAW